MSKKFSVLVDVTLDENKYKELLGYGTRPDNWDNPIEYVQHALQEECRVRGLSVTFDTQEVEKHLSERLSESRTAIMRDDATEEIENEILNNKKCIGGVCED